ncbi:hypothetical protein ACWDKQ_05610 [Saccharopolyspora sp. NPDC000995]
MHRVHRPSATVRPAAAIDWASSSPPNRRRFDTGWVRPEEPVCVLLDEVEQVLQAGNVHDQNRLLPAGGIKLHVTGDTTGTSTSRGAAQR